MQIIDLTKKYITNGESVTALDGISLELPYKGLVFIVGKSGCGKSTLLNVLSGMDGYDGGDVSFEGRSLKDLSPAELDCYRNHYCSFVFEENNLIPELNVYENIALAGELRGMKDVKSKVASALEKVGLKGYEKRKVTSLSGGQRQRIAIARSIVKDPKLIFADEPCGALDRATGEAVFELLKELSSDKLVLVVSQDAAAAQKYGDRIIELSDGKVISDTDSTYKSETDKQSTFTKKKSRLPILTAIKLGCSNFKFHPFRLVATVILAMITFTFLGIALNPVFDNLASIAYSTMEKQNLEQSLLNKFTYQEDYPDDFYITDIPVYFQNSKFNIVERTELEKDGGPTLPIVQAKRLNNLVTLPDAPYYRTPQYATSATQETLDAWGFSIDGKLPQKGEVAITEYTAEVLSDVGLIYDGKKVNYTRDELIGKEILLENSAYKISGIIDTGFNANLYRALKTISNDMDFIKMFVAELGTSAHNLLFLDSSVLDANSFEADVKMDILLNVTMNDDRFDWIYKVSRLTDEVKFDILDEDGIYIPTYILSRRESNYLGNLDVVIEKYWNEHKNVLYEEAMEQGFIRSIDTYYNFIFQNFSNPYGPSCGEIIFEAIKEYKDELICNTIEIVDQVSGKKWTTKAKGVYLYNESILNISSAYSTPVLADESLYSSMYDAIGESYIGLIVNQKFLSRSEFEEFYGNPERRVSYKLSNYVVDSVVNMTEKINSVKKIMTYLSVAFAVFALLLMLNYMDKQNMTGILKSLGCKNFDLIKCFIIESFLIGICVFALSLVGHSILGGILSSFFSSMYGGIYFAVFGVTPIVSLILLGAIFIFSSIGCILPIARLSK